MCDFPGCTFHNDPGSDWCVHHRKHYGEPEPKKTQKRIPFRSEKRSTDQLEYRRMVKDMLAENKNCEIKSPVCTGIAQGLDHTQKRSPKNFLDRENVKRACNACNLYKEENPIWAKENGHSISRFKN